MGPIVEASRPHGKASRRRVPEDSEWDARAVLWRQHLREALFGAPRPHLTG